MFFPSRLKQKQSDTVRQDLCSQSFLVLKVVPSHKDPGKDKSYPQRHSPSIPTLPIGATLNLAITEKVQMV